MDFFKAKRITSILITSIFLYSCNNKPTLFTTLSSSKTNINFQNNLPNKKGLSILYYLYYYNGGGVSIGDINNDGLPDIYFTANSKGHNKLFLNKGNYQFEDITEKAGVQGISDWCTGSTMADINGDGLLDIYVSTVSNRYGLKGHNELYINNGDGTFTEKSAAYGLSTSCFSTQAVFFDYDHDGDLDCYILNQSHNPNQNIVDTSHRKIYDSLAGDRLYRNDLNITGKFTEVSASAGILQSNLGYGLGISVADINNDGWDDIYIGNDFHENDYYYINQKNGTFKEEGSKHFGHYSRFSMGNDIADFNNDGQPDIVTVDMLPPDEKTMKTYGSDEHFDTYNFKIKKNGFQDQVSRNCLQRNNGNGVSFSDVALMSGVSATDWSWCPLFADFNNDGNKDLFITSGIVKRPVDLDYVQFVSALAAKVDRNSSDKYDASTISRMPDGASHPFLFLGDGASKFTDVSNNWGLGSMKGYFNGAAYADLNNSGKLDIVINCLNAPAMILKNNADAKNYLSISFKGINKNTFGIGAKAYLFCNGKMQYQELMLTRGFESSSDTKLHFGLDSTKIVDSILVIWPNQKYQVVKNITPNKKINFSETDASGVFSYDAFFPPVKPIFTDITNQVNCNWQHKENDFIDFNSQFLIPHKESTRGPKIVVGDVNKDGLDDFYVCGAKGQAGALMIQQKDGNFIAEDTTLFNQFAICEDVDAKFFDANGDGYLDLWVVSGGNEKPSNDLSNVDRLYINDAKGHFNLSLKAIPQIYHNKSCITVADIDHDGDMDVFIGHLNDQFKYGVIVPSYLYLNDGKGNFTMADNKILSTFNMGMITSASFIDLNNDGWQDLVVGGEFTPIKIYMNNNGIFTETDVPQSTGLWQCIYTADVNGDGFPDILAGNWGHNSKLWAGKNGPIKMYVKDFDDNGFIEQILCYTIDGKEYTFLGKDELEKSLPVLKKAYLTYDEVAGKTVQYMFYDLFNNYTEFKAETLSSSVFINDGKGNFKREDLPDALQMAPVMAFSSTQNKNNFIAGGNFYGVIPYEGKYDALFPTIFSYNQNYTSILPVIDGEIHDMKWINYAKGGKILVLALNNKKLVFLKPQ